MKNETTNEENEQILPRAVNDEAAETVAEAETPVTLESLRADLDNSLAELATLESERAELTAELRRASESPEAFSPDRIITIRCRQEEISVALSLSKIREREAQLTYYGARLQTAEWRQESEIADRDRLGEQFSDIAARFEAAQGLTGATSQEVHDLRQAYFRVQAELTALRAAFLKAQSQQALHTPLPEVHDLNESVRRELAAIGHKGKKK